MIQRCVDLSAGPTKNFESCENRIRLGEILVLEIAHKEL